MTPDLLSTDAAVSVAIVVAALSAMAATVLLVVRSRVRWRRRRALRVGRELEAVLEAAAGRPREARAAVRIARRDRRVATETLISAARNGADPDLVAQVAAASGVERFCRRRADAVDALQRESAVSWLGALGLRDASEVVAGALRDPSARVRVAAARAWTELHGQEAVADVVGMFATEPPQVRERLAQILVGLGPGAGDAIMEEATVAASRAEIDPLLVRVVGQRGTGSRLTYLELASQSVRTDVRVAVASVARGPAAADLIATFAADPVPEVRAAAVANPSCPLAAIAPRVGDPSWLVRTAATYALARRDGGHRILTAAADDIDPTASAAAADQARIAETADTSAPGDASADTAQPDG